MLLDRGAIADLEDNRGRIPMQVLVEHLLDFGYEDLDIAQLLLENGTYINAQDKHNINPLHLASYCRQIEIAKVLLGRGANVSAKDALGQTHYTWCHEAHISPKNVVFVSHSYCWSMAQT